LQRLRSREVPAVLDHPLDGRAQLVNGGVGLFQCEDAVHLTTMIIRPWAWVKGM
jgi:hypothetical protein